MRKNLAAISGLAALCLVAQHSHAGAASPSPEDRYVAARDAAIAKISKLYDAKSDDAAQKAEDVMRADLLAQMKAIVGDTGRKGYGPVKLSLLSFYKGDEDFGALDIGIIEIEGAVMQVGDTAQDRIAHGGYLHSIGGG